MSNDALSDEEACHIKPTLSLTEFKWRKELQIQLATYDTLLAPHKLLPPEVLSQIFVAAFPSSTQIPTRKGQSPLVLCKVCSRWRRVALATPELWTDVTLRLSATPGTSPEGAIEATIGWFKRSEASKLSFMLLNELHDSVMTNSSDSEFEPWPESVAARATRRDSNERLIRMALHCAVLPFAHRLSSLRRTLPAALIAELLTVATPFPELRRVSLQRGCWDYFDWQRWVARTDFKSLAGLQRTTAPHLVDLELVGMDSIVPTQLLDISWGKLTRLNITSNTQLYPERCHAILTKCQHLQECSLVVALDEHNSMSSGPLLTIMHLHTLSLQYYGPSHPDATQCAEFFSPLLTPALKSLVVNWPLRLDRCSTSTFAKNPETCHFLGFLKWSNCTLEKLQSDIPGGDEQVENIALALPSLVEFRIEAPWDRYSRFGASTAKVHGGKCFA